MPAESASGDTEATGAALPGLGELLQKGRKDVGLSVEQVADNLHLDERIVEALESGEFEEIGAPVFVRGHLKAYARVLRIEEARVLEAYEAALPAEPAEPELARRPSGSPFRISPGPWAMGVTALLLAVALGLYVLRDDRVPEAAVSPEPLPATPAPVASNARLPAPAEPEPMAAAAVAEVIEVPASEPEPEPGPLPGPEPELAPEPETEFLVPPAEPVALTPEPAAEEPGTSVALELYFREESWVEISNPERRILFGLQREGMRRELTGDPPIQILLGNAPAVDVYLDGQPYPIPPRSLTGKVARFTIDPSAEASGE